MRTIFTCTPRADVLSGEIGEARFVASLTALLPYFEDSNIDPVYQDPDTFFQRTYPTDGLKTLMREVFGRLWGFDPTSAPVLRIETGFGGGKTHNLIALYHTATGKVSEPYLREYFPEEWLRKPREPVRVAVVVGDALNPVDGLIHPDGTKTYTPWGEIAYQLGGTGLYEQIRRSDETGIPGAIPWRKIFGDQPVLILIDELAPYLRMLKAGGRQALLGHLAPFLKSLLEAVASSPRAVCVLTLAESMDAFGEETDEIAQVLTSIVDELRAISARIERILSPTSGEGEIANILTRRLFESVDRDAAREAVYAYRSALEDAQRQGADLPPTALTPQYAELIEKSYPFHPELLIVLNRKVSTIPNFHRTRGALRLLAHTIRRLWEIRPADVWLIHPHHLDLSHEPIVEELTSRLNRPRYKEVIHADIISPVAERAGFATEIDREWMGKGRRPAAVRTATTIFLHSLTQHGNVGVRTEEVMLACLEPGDDPHLLQEALRELERRCWYLECIGERWRFQTEPSLNKMIVDEMQYVGTARAKRILDDRLRGIWRSGIFEVRTFPAEPSEIPDDAGKPKLAILHYDAASVVEKDDVLPDLVRRLYREKGTVGEPRMFQNNLLFLVCDEAQKDSMVQAAKYYEAVRRLAESSERQRFLSPEQRQRLRTLKDESDLRLRIAIHRAYRFLYYPSADAPRSTEGLSREALPPQDQGTIQQDQTQVILDALRRLEKVYTADDRPIAPEFIKRHAWPHGAEEVPVRDVMRAFAMRRGLRILLDPNPLREGIRQGIQRGLWIYYDPDEKVGYGQESLPPQIRLDGEAVLMVPERAREKNVPILGRPSGAERCPVCGNPAEQCTCQPPPPPPLGEIWEATGTIEQALQGIIDQMTDRKVRSVERLFIQVHGNDAEGVRELRSLGVAVPQMNGTDCRLRIRVTAEFGDHDRLQIEFRGPWDLYRQMKDVLSTLLERSRKTDIQAEAECHRTSGWTSSDLRRLQDVLRHLDFGRVTLKARPIQES